MNLELLKKFLATHAQLKIAAIFLVIVLAVFLWRGKAGNDNWSDEIFFAELLGLGAINILLLIFYRALPYKKVIFPWLLALLATCGIIAYVAAVGFIKASSPMDLLTNFTSFGIFPLRFFGLFATAPEGDSTRAALLDTQLTMIAGFMIGWLLQKYLRRAQGGDII